MRGLAVMVIICVLMAEVSAQSDTTSQKQGHSDKKRLVIVPFEGRMFLTDLMNQLVTEGQSSQKAVNDLSNRLQVAISMAVIDSVTTYSFMNATSREHDLEKLTRLHAAITYRYLALHPNKADGRQTEKERRVISQGQLRSERDTVQRYMAADVVRPDVLAEMGSDGWADYYLFLTQLDVNRDLSDPEQAMLNGYYTVAVHFTLTDINGKHLHGGLARHDLEGRADIRHIQNEAFPAIARQISKVIFPEKLEEKKEK